MGKGNFYIACLRHGQTPLNAEGKIIGSYDDSLNHVGIRQSHAAARELQKIGIPWKRVVSSSLRRTMHTALIIADDLQIPIKDRFKDLCFNERNVGKYQGQKNSPEITARFLSEEKLDKSVEEYSKFSARVQAGWKSVISAKQDTIIISHSLPIADIIKNITGVRPEELPKNAAPIIFEFNQKGEFIKIVEVTMECCQNA